MTPLEMEKDAVSAINARQRMTLVTQRGSKMPKGFPRGKFLCENHDGTVVRSYDPKSVLKWLQENKLTSHEYSMRPRA